MEGTVRARVRNWTAALAVVLSAALVASAAPAEATGYERIRLGTGTSSTGPAKPRAVFRAETESSPQATIVGHWSENATASNEARLWFGGGHAVGARTTFFGTWVSPISTSSKSPSMTIDYELGYMNGLGDEIPLVHAVRAKFANGGWGRWVKAETPIADAESSIVSGKVSVAVPLKKPRRVQFQWKIVGEVVGPASIEGDFQLNVS